MAALMDTNQSVARQGNEILRDILDSLKRQEAIESQNHKERKLDSRRDSFSQICSMYAVIAKFIATLGVAFLTYMHDTFVEKSQGTPMNATDEVITICLFSSVLLSISSSIALGFGASPTPILSLPTKDAIRDLGSFMLAIGFPFSSQFMEQMFGQRRRSEGGSPIGLHGIDVHHALTTSQLRHRAPRRVVQAAVNFRSALRRSNALPRTESQFVVGMLLVAVGCILLSFVSLSIGVITFAWAELGKRVAIFMTASLAFPFAVVACVAAIYKCTLSRLDRENRALSGDTRTESGSTSRSNSPV